MRALMIGFMFGVPLLAAGCYASHTRSSESDAGRTEEPSGVCIRPLPPCDVDADCGSTPPWACRSGRCAYVGCERDAQCRADEACVRSHDTGECRQRCRGTADCASIASYGGPTTCLGGSCVESGCPSAEWCREFAGRGRWRCEPDPGSLTNPELAMCRETCDRDADCSGGLSACVDGYCRSAPCRSDEECFARFGDERLECRLRP